MNSDTKITHNIIKQYISRPILNDYDAPLDYDDVFSDNVQIVGKQPLMLIAVIIVSLGIWASVFYLGSSLLNLLVG